MKTWDGKSPPQQKPCGSCGPAQERMKLIKQVHEALVYGHTNVAALYRTLAAEDSTSEEDRVRLVQVAEAHERMAKESSNVSVPDHLKDPS